MSWDTAGSSSKGHRATSQRRRRCGGSGSRSDRNEPTKETAMAASGTAKTQGALWNLAANDWACLLEWHMAPAWEMALTLAGVGRGTRFLDGGCGSGGACKIAARLGAHVTGLDAAPALLAIARDRVPDGKFEAGELQDLPFADGTFDAVLTANSLQYTADPAATLAGIRRGLSALGPYSLVHWGRSAECEHE